jgi:hypothetical protein
VATAESFGGVLSRRRLRKLGIDDQAIRRAAEAKRCAVHGRQTVALDRAPLSPTAARWRAVWEVGEGITALDGIGALQAEGLTGFDDDKVHVSIPHPCRPLAVSGVRIHRVRRWDPAELLPVELPRMRTDVAAVRAAHWADTDRQAALILCLVTQQRLTTPFRLMKVAEGHIGRRDRLVAAVSKDLLGGAHSLGELDFARICLEWRLPPPSRQVVRTGARGRVYLDVCWEDVGLAVEIDGSQHRLGLAVTDDNLRQNAVTIGGEMVLRIDVIGLRIAEREFMTQVVDAYRTLATRASRRG